MGRIFINGSSRYIKITCVILQYANSTITTVWLQMKQRMTDEINEIPFFFFSLLNNDRYVVVSPSVKGWLSLSREIFNVPFFLLFSKRQGKVRCHAFAKLEFFFFFFKLAANGGNGYNKCLPSSYDKHTESSSPPPHPPRDDDRIVKRRIECLVA